MMKPWFVVSRTLMPVLLLSGLLAFTACQQEEPATEEPAAADQAAEKTKPAPEPTTEEAATAEAPEQAVVVTALDYAFQGGDEVPSGWTKFRLRNEGEQHHFMLIYRLPEGHTFQELQESVVPIFDEVMASLQAGDIDKDRAGEILGERIPAWFFESTFWGGPGLVAPGRTAETTILLDEPGTYVMECYVKSPDGRFHSSMGMAKPFTVTEESSGRGEPEADLDLTVSNSNIEFADSVSPGRHTIRVNMTAEPEGLLPYDVHLARLEVAGDLENAVGWMDWMDVGGLRAPSPVEFVGGAEQMPAGSTAYVTVDLEAGRYAWLPETHADDGMVAEFSVE